MALAKKGTRKIEVDGICYRWVIRRKPTYSEALEWSNLKAAVELYDKPASILSIDFLCPRNDSWLERHNNKVTPKHIVFAVLEAIASGWKPQSNINHEIQHRIT